MKKIVLLLLFINKLLTVKRDRERLEAHKRIFIMNNPLLKKVTIVSPTRKLVQKKLSVSDLISQTNNARGSETSSIIAEDAMDVDKKLLEEIALQKQ